MDKETETNLTEMTKMLRYLAEHNPAVLLRAGDAIAREFGALRRREAADAPPQAQILGASPGVTMEMIHDAHEAQRQAKAVAKLELLRAECAEIVKTIPPTKLALLKALVGDNDVLIAQRYRSIVGGAIPGLE
jgi:hypothetical protein